MTTFTSTCIRLFTGMALALLLSVAISSNSYAQACFCDNITVIVDPSVACTIELHPSAPLCKYRPVFASPGTSVQIACCDDMNLRIVTCDGSDVVFTQNSRLPVCFTGVPIGRGCCVDACLTIDPNTGCPVIRITPSSVRCPLC